MEILKMKLSDLKTDNLYLLSFPIRPETSYQIMQKFFPLPAIIINSNHSIIFGIDLFYYLKTKNLDSVNTIKMDIPNHDALILNYNLKEKFIGVNLYEKLMFIKKMSLYIKPQELQRKTELKIPINRELMQKLDLLCRDEYQNILSNEKISLKTALKICQLKKKDQQILIQLFTIADFSSSQQVILIEMLEEITFRDKSTVAEILGEIMSIPCQDPKEILARIYKLRYPIYSQMEKDWQEKVKKMKLPDQIKISHTPFFEKKEIYLNATFRNLEEFKKCWEGGKN